jgi:purine-binding chemotaxis protein CheW
MPGFIRGVINLRGRVVPVIDLAARFGRSETAVARRTSIVIVETVGKVDEEGFSEVQDIGIMVDAVNEVVDIPGDDLEPPPAFGAGIRPDFISGMARQGTRFTIVLDVNRVLSVDEMASMGQVRETGPQPGASRDRV